MRFVISIVTVTYFKGDKMKKEWYKKNKHILDAWAEGKEVEVFMNGRWFPVGKEKELWIEDAEYRIKPEVTYPIYAKRKDIDVWVRFDSEKTYEIIGMKPPTDITKVYGGYIGETVGYGIPYTDKDKWEIIPNPYELRDKDPVWCWDEESKVERTLNFYDAENNCAFTNYGYRNGIRYDYYEKVMPWEEPKWVERARKELK